MKLKVHKGGRDPRCPACRRRLKKLGSRHKKFAHGPWCDGVVDPLKKRAGDLFCRVNDVARGMLVDGRYADVITLISPIEGQLPPRERGLPGR